MQEQIVSAQEHYKTIKMVARHNEWLLFLKTVATLLQISFLCSIGKEHRLFSNKQRKKKPAPSEGLRQRVVRYVNVSLFVYRRFGVRYGCFTRSALLCKMMQNVGVDVTMQFGITKREDSVTGHCWIEENGRQCPDYEIIHSYS